MVTDELESTRRKHFDSHQFSIVPESEYGEQEHWPGDDEQYLECKHCASMVRFNTWIKHVEFHERVGF